jgi:predicted TIM-barrel fold metal-dependent hydrolase
MDASGVDVAIILPTFAPFLVYNDDADAERSRAYAAAYNHWLSDFCAFAPRRLVGAALLSRHDAQAMVGDLDDALKKGFRVVVLRPNPVRGRTLGSSDYRRFWAACEASDVTVLVHEGTHTPVSTAGADRFESHFAQHACSHPLEAMMALLALIDGGVLETHPTLRVAFLEAGCSWLPYWLWRLDEVEYAQFGNEVRARVRRKPSEYFQRQCWIAMEPSEPLLDRVANYISPTRLLFGTDFPHLDHDAHIVDEVLAQRSRLGEANLRMILWDNACNLLGLKAPTGGSHDLNPNLPHADT